MSINNHLDPSLIVTVSYFEFAEMFFAVIQSTV